MSDGNVTRSDIEAKFRELQSDMSDAAESAKGKVTIAAAVAGVLVLLLVYVLGRKAGKKRSTVVEIRRL
ncbi:MAG: hypothetical protein GEV08_02755 [Acidimicrobiia bacterium]|nr:hypothetical protein [Acidimicrobiia bacterium]